MYILDSKRLPEKLHFKISALGPESIDSTEICNNMFSNEFNCKSYNGLSSRKNYICQINSESENYGDAQCGSNNGNQKLKWVDCDCETIYDLVFYSAQNQNTYDWTPTKKA
ncbi:MAG TPA: hypothetical protein P5277_00720 [Candidatus Paceibacterota bacterium]|nr:hypothetical protein [Candidatus Paceibacterota bacterium]